MASIIISILIFAVLVVIGVFVSVVAYKNKKNKIEPDYYTFFILGITWLPLGIVFMTTMDNPLTGSFFFIIGLIYLAMGLFNRNKWNVERHKWKNLTKGQKNFKILILVLLGVLVVIGLVAYFLVKEGI